MSRCFPLLLTGVLCVGSVQAQLDWLTLRESGSLVERIPDVVAAQKKGECPNFSPGYDEPGKLMFQVRRECGPEAGTLIDNYSVDRKTGKVVLWGDNPQPVADNQGTVLAAQLAREARKRILSASEAQCLALEAATALPGWGGADAVVSVKPFGKMDRIESTMHFTGTRVSSTRPVESGRMLTVYLAQARVRDDQTGVDLMSAGVGNLSSKLLELRAPVWLSDEEAAFVALVVPRVASNLRDACKLNVGGAFYSREALMGVSCKDRGIRESNVLVNLETGAVTDPDTGKSLESAETARVAHELLSNAQKRKAELQTGVEAACRPQ